MIKMDWWETTSSFEKIFWYFAISGTMLVLIQVVMTFLGAGVEDIEMGDMDADVDTDVDGHGGGDGEPEFHFFTIRNLILLAAFFGWGGIMAQRMGVSKPMTIIVGLVSGGLFALLISLIIFTLVKFLNHGGRGLKIDNALDQIGTVYLPIPESNSGSGMVQLSMKGAVRELNAMTSGPKLATGEKVRVIYVVDKGTVQVEKI
ncbi:MAG: hypothetical protein ACLFQV_07090 [Vulcanimicrobiota bacterium]